MTAQRREFKRMIRLFVCFILSFLIVGIVSGCSRGVEEKPLRIALIPGGDAPAELERYAPILDYLGEQVGREIEPVLVTSYAAVVVALNHGDIDIARLGPFSYVLAVEEAQAEALVRGVRKSTGKDAYHSIVITRSDSGIEELGDIRGKSFAVSDVGSAGGYLVPMAMLLQYGIIPETDFSELHHTGSHLAVIEAVKTGSVDAGAVSDQRLDDAIEAGTVAVGEIRVVAVSAPIPSSPKVVASGMDPELKRALLDAFLSMPPDLAALGVGTLSHYVEAKDEDYDVMRDVAELLDLDLSEME